MAELLEVEGVTVRFGNVAALTDVSMSVAEGQVHGLIGPNGAGKSTLLNVLSGGVRSRAGSVRFDGDDIGGRSVRWRRNHGLSRSFQRTSIFPALTIRDQLNLVGRGDMTQLERIARTFGLTHLLDHRADTTSYGDQRRVDIALAVIGRSRMLLLDEPAAGLTVQETDDLFGHVVELTRSEGITALIVEHDVDAVFRYCERVTVLDLGRVLASGAPAEVRADPAVVSAYLGSAA